MKTKLHFITRSLLLLPGQVCVWTYFWAKYWLVEKPRRQPPKLYHGHSQPTGLWCICAIYQPKRVSPNLIAYLACLRDAGYNVIAVHNGKGAPDLVEALTPFCHTVMLRSPGGRDFGSYREGTLYLNELTAGEDIRQVAYCNDSLFIKPSALAAMMAQIREMPDDYIGAIETHERRYHVQSWFFGVSGNVFHAGYFQQFWSNYIPTSHRGRNMKRSELGLSQYLMKHNLYPRIIYPIHWMLHRILSIQETELPRRLILLSPASKHYRLYPDLQNVFTAFGYEHPASSGTTPEEKALPLGLRLMIERSLFDISDGNPMSAIPGDQESP